MVGQYVRGRRIGEEGSEEGFRFELRMELQVLFSFQMCFRPHMALVLAYILRISEVTRDPAPQTNMILAVAL